MELLEDVNKIDVSGVVDYLLELLGKICACFAMLRRFLFHLSRLRLCLQILRLRLSFLLLWVKVLPHRFTIYFSLILISCVLSVPSSIWQLINWSYDGSLIQICRILAICRFDFIILIVLSYLLSTLPIISYFFSISVA